MYSLFYKFLVNKKKAFQLKKLKSFSKTRVIHIAQEQAIS
jgi:hypothetical protein